jgi:glycosyltransferase 2 family protein
MRTLLRWLLRLVGPALLLLFLATSDLGRLWQILSGAAIGPVIWSLLLFPPFVLIKSWRWIQLLRAMGLDLDLKTAIGLYIVGIFYGATTPGQAGDLLKAVYLHRRGQPTAAALMSVVLDRLSDLVVMSALATIGVFALGQLLPTRELQQAVVVVMALGLTATVTVLVARTPRSWLLTGLLPRFAPRMKALLDTWNLQLHQLRLTPQLLLTVSISSLLSAAFTFVRLWLLFVALNLTAVPLATVVGASALIAVLQVLPISIGGVGVRDVVLIAVLAPYGYSQEQALTLSALFLLINVEHIVIGFLMSFRYPLTAQPAESA